MATIGEHRAALKAALETLEDNVFDYESKSFPAGARWVVSWPEEYDPRPTMGSERTIVYPVRFEIPWGDDESSDEALEIAMDAVRAAIETDTTLSAYDAVCAPFTNIGATRLPDDTVVMQFVVPVEVYD